MQRRIEKEWLRKVAANDFAPANSGLAPPHSIFNNHGTMGRQWHAVIFLTSVAILSPGLAHADIGFWELIPRTINSQPFVFELNSTLTADSLFLTVKVKPRSTELSKIHDRVGGRVYPCQETETHREFAFRGMRCVEDEGSLVFSVRVARGPNLPCFYFWCFHESMPGGDVYWLRLDSPLLSGRADPK